MKYTLMEDVVYFEKDSDEDVNINLVINVDKLREDKDLGKVSFQFTPEDVSRIFPRPLITLVKADNTTLQLTLSKEDFSKVLDKSANLLIFKDYVSHKEPLRVTTLDDTKSPRSFSVGSVMFVEKEV